MSKYSFKMEDNNTPLQQQPQTLQPYELLLFQQTDHIHEVINDIVNCKLEDIRRTKLEEMKPILSLFRGGTPYKQRENLIEFLRLMPEYKTTDPNKLYQRLTTLQAHLTTKGEITDLLIWAMYKQQKFLEKNENRT